ncbi:hypothetical protein D9757_010581 [Collybiopsis confluens]|uniref:Uncharacterized protein n=1 Tax=Collybiopsis confluens TaxID=2823264 RepID=A0A8H5GW40_9AGAR|nr:hypothetical protein D9757_010581 [Collybiopsis confluens]
MLRVAARTDSIFLNLAMPAVNPSSTIAQFTCTKVRHHNPPPAFLIIQAELFIDCGLYVYLGTLWFSMLAGLDLPPEFSERPSTD